MSYDLRIWCQRSAALHDLLEDPWTADGDGWSLESKSWTAGFSSAQNVEFEDVPDEAARMLPGIGFLVEASLSPIHAPESALAKLRKAAQAIAKAAGGVIEDPQEDSFQLARGMKRYAAPERSKRFTEASLSWWFTGNVLATSEGARRLLEAVKSRAAEAVPRRFGEYEPPQHKTAEVGVPALADFIADTSRAFGGVYYVAPPFVDFGVSVSRMIPDPRLGFRCNRVEIGLDSSVLQDDGWSRAVRGLWRDVSRVLQPFYGEVRALRGVGRGRGTTWSDMETEVHPVRSWFWRGIPRTPPIAMVLGSPYRELWRPPRANVDGNLVFSEPSAWTAEAQLQLEVPEALAQRWTPDWIELPTGGHTVNWCDEYPEEWPFEAF